MRGAVDVVRVMRAAEVGVYPTVVGRERSSQGRLGQSRTRESSNEPLATMAAGVAIVAGVLVVAVVVGEGGGAVGEAVRACPCRAAGREIVASTRSRRRPSRARGSTAVARWRSLSHAGEEQCGGAEEHNNGRITSRPASQL